MRLRYVKINEEVNMIQLLHLSDLHLNAGFSNKSNHIREQLKVGNWRSFERAIQYVLNQPIDGLILAGDIFDNPQIDYKLEREFFSSIKLLMDSQKHVFYVSGNHDLSEATPFLNTFKAETYFHMFDIDVPTRKTVDFGNGKILEVVGFGHHMKMKERDILREFPIKSNGNPWIGIGHASVLSAKSVGEKTAYMATSLDAIRRLNYDYFALGHIHIQQMLSDKIAYSGNLQGLNYKEIGPKGGLIVTLEGHDTQVSPVYFNEVLWEAFDFEISSEIDRLPKLEDAIESFVRDELNEISHDCQKLIIRLNLSGRTSLYHMLKDAKTIEDLETLLTVKLGLLSLNLKDIGLSNDIDLESLKREKTVLALTLDIVDDPEKYPELMSRLMSLPIFKAQKSNEEKMAQLKRILEDIQPEIVDRMLKVKYEN